MGSQDASSIGNGLLRMTAVLSLPQHITTDCVLPSKFNGLSSTIRKATVQRQRPDGLQTPLQLAAHLVVDDLACYRCLDDLTVPWAAPGANENGLHIEQAGYAAWSREQWLAHDQTIERCAFHVAEWSSRYSIPAVLLSAEDLVAGRSGITTHAAVSDAFHQSDHTDPGQGYPLDELVVRARSYMPPHVARIEPNSGPAGTEVVITGTGFTTATDVGFGSVNAADMRIHSDTEISAIAPQGEGAVDLTVISPAGESDPRDAPFTYE